MSLVELALRKMQEAAAKATPPPQGRRLHVMPRSTEQERERAAELDPTFVGPTTDGREPRAYPGQGELEAQSDSGSTAAKPPATVTSRPLPTRTDKQIRIDRESLRALGLLPPEHHERVLADQYRQIKRPLIANATGRGGVERLPKGQLIMVASAMPGEGKTFTSLNLALSIAMEKDVSVLLIDADALKPHIDRALGIQGEPGLLDLLRDESLHPESFIIPTDVPGLSVLPIGDATETTTELLASHRMEEIMGMLVASDSNRIAVIDSPPLLLTSESRVLADAVGQIVLVVRAESTLQQSVLDAISHLGEDKSIGLVLNQSTNVAPSGYYYGYGSGERAV